MKLVGSDTLFWKGGLNVGMKAGGKPVDLPPVVGPDEAATVAGSQIIISVLDNDIDPEGGALTVTEATALHGTVAVNPDGTLSYTAPEEFSGIDTVTYKVTDPAGNVSEGEVAVAVFILRVTEGAEDGEFTVEAAPGELSITVVEDGEAEEYTLQIADLAQGPVNLRSPRIAGTAEVGAPLTIEPGLWASDEAQGPLAVSWAWMRDDAPITDATGTTHVVGPADHGHALHVVETASTSAGTRQAASLPAETAALTSWTPAGESSLSGWWDASDTASLTVSGSSVTRIASRIAGGVALSTTDPANAMILVEADPDFQDRQVLVPKPDWASSRTTARKGYLAEAAIDARCIFVVTSYMAGNASTYDDYALLFGDHNGQYNQPRMMGEKLKSEFFSSGLFAGARARFNGSDGLAALPMPGAMLYFDHGSTKNIQLIFNHFSGGSEIRTWSGPIAEIVVLDAAPDQALIERMEGYLAHKWGCADRLSAAHPYKAAAPTS